MSAVFPDDASSLRLAAPMPVAALRYLRDYQAYGHRQGVAAYADGFEVRGETVNYSREITRL